MGRQHDGPQLPGMENLGDDAIMMGGIDQNTEIPAGMEFTVSGAPDGEFSFQCSANGPGTLYYYYYYYCTQDATTARIWMAVSLK
jgi:hypothetical protein